MDWSTEICQLTYTTSRRDTEQSYHFYCVERLKLVLYPLKNTFLENISGQKDKNLPET